MYSRLVIIILILTCGITGRVNAQNSNQALYGYFFYTIAKYIEWPADYKTGDFVIGVVGDTPVAGLLRTMAEKKDIAGRQIKVAEFSSVSQISKCNMLFIPVQKSEEIEQIIAKMAGSSTLLVTEKEGLAMKGSCINFVTTTGGKLAFELNRAAVEKANLKVASELARFAIML